MSEQWLNKGMANINTMQNTWHHHPSIIARPGLFPAI